MPHYVVGVGGCGPQAKKAVEQAIAQLTAHPLLEVRGQSPSYANPPAGGVTAYGFVNAAICLGTRLSPDGLWQVLRDTEWRLGRIRLLKNGARTVDLDVLLFEGGWLKTPFLNVPHPRLEKRAFALIPALEALTSAGRPLPLPLQIAAQRVFSTGRLFRLTP